MSPKSFYINYTLIFFLTAKLLSPVSAATNDKDIEKLFDWAQSEYSNFFDSSESTQIHDIWHYRYYPNTGNYVGVNNSNEVYVLGSSFGGLTFVGMLKELVSLIPENFVYTQKIAEIGMPAAGFPENYIYYNVENPGIGPNGDIAFSGAADVAVRSTDANINAVWAGRPGDFKVLIQQNDTISGLPSNILFDEKVEHSDSEPPTITRSGHVAFLARVKGAVNEQAILAYVNDQVKKVILAGEQAPGFPNGTVVGRKLTFSFSDAGLVISGFVGSSINQSSQPALWFWDFNTVTLLAAGDKKASLNVQPLSETLEFPIQDCDFSLFGAPLINNEGDIVVSSSVSLAGVNDCPNGPVNALLKINSSGISVVHDSATSLFANDSLTSTDLNFSTLAYDLNAVGGVSFSRGSLLMATTGNYSTWYNSSDEGVQIISMSGEKLPVDFSTLISDWAMQNVFVNKNDDAVVYIIESSILSPNYGKKFILSGKPRVQGFYDSADQAGESHLSLVVELGMQPPGLNSTDFFKDIGAPVITDNGDIIFAASISSALDGSSYQSLWRAKPDGTMHRLTYDGQHIKVGNTVEPVSFFFPLDLSTYRGIGNGRANIYSDVGRVVFQGELRNGNPIYLLSYYD